MSPVGVEGSPGGDGAAPDAFALGAAYPNPFRDAASFTLAIPEAAHVVATAYDLLGREVAVLVDEPLAAGEYASRSRRRAYRTGCTSCGSSPRALSPHDG